MGLRAYVGAAIGFVVGFLISNWFLGSAPAEGVLLTMCTVCAFVGAIGGFAAGAASKAGNQQRAMIAAGVGLAGCLVVGLVIWAFRSLFP
jgi:hypothetical protein